MNTVYRIDCTFQQIAPGDPCSWQKKPFIFTGSSWMRNTVAEKLEVINVKIPPQSEAVFYYSKNPGWNDLPGEIQSATIFPDHYMRGSARSAG